MPKTKHQVRQGLAYVRRTPELLIPLVVIAVVGTLAWEFQVTLPLMASKAFYRGAAAYGVMASVMGAGAVVGGLPTVLCGILALPALTRIDRRAAGQSPGPAEAAGAEGSTGPVQAEAQLTAHPR